jgi:hypothetical protein
MRESLGWVTTCPDDRRCPQNWLELAASELPTTVYCHVCEQAVQLVITQEDYDRHSAGSAPVAFPVLPCAGPAAQVAYTPSGAPAHSASGNGAGGPAVAAVTPEPPPPVPAPPPAREKEPERPRKDKARELFVTLLSGESIKLDKDTMIIGRSRTCDIVIPSAKVSRQHASITRVSGEFFLEDLGSANGVWKDGEKVGRTKISAGDVFTISEETLTFDAK